MRCNGVAIYVVRYSRLNGRDLLNPGVRGMLTAYRLAFNTHEECPAIARIKLQQSFLAVLPFACVAIQPTRHLAVFDRKKIVTRVALDTPFDRSV
jgi:hypothetical protein